MKYSSISRLLGGVETPRFFHFVENLIEISLKHISLLYYLGIFRHVNLSEVTSFCSSLHFAFLTVINLHRRCPWFVGFNGKVVKYLEFPMNFVNLKLPFFSKFVHEGRFLYVLFALHLHYTYLQTKSYSFFSPPGPGVTWLDQEDKSLVLERFDSSQ